jgi:hypothetical protein
MAVRCADVCVISVSQIALFIKGVGRNIHYHMWLLCSFNNQYVCVYVYVWVYVYVCVGVCVGVCGCVGVCICVSVCVCV